MHMIYFITGNKGKLAEIQSVLPEVVQLDIDLPEIQDIDPKKVIIAKLHGARRHQEGSYIVEDTSLSFACLNQLPGTFIKWFSKALGNEGLYDLVARYGNDRAEARTMLGYMSASGDIEYFEGVIPGRIVEQEGDTGFGWDPIFLPDGHEKTFAQMSMEEKNLISMRRIAVEKLAEYLKK